MTMSPLTISSAQNPRVKQLVKLRDRRDREAFGKTILEGYRLVSRAFDYGWPIEECYYCPDFFLGKNEAPLLERLGAAGVALFELTAPVFTKASYRDRPEGLLAVSPIRAHPLAAMPSPERGLYLVAEAIEKPGNLGSISRSADAAGATGLLVCDRKTDIYNPNVLTASTGAIFCVPFAECASEEALSWLRERGVATLAATPHAEPAYYDLDLTQSLAIVVGAEQYGLSDFWMENADHKVRIPMGGKMDSLNVATATSVLLFEVARQRAVRAASIR